MARTIRRTLCWLLALPTLSAGLLAQTASEYHTVASFNSRAAALGWANTGRQATLADGLYNPATIPASRQQWQLLFNIPGATAALYNWEGLTSGGSRHNIDQLHRWGLILKGAAWHSPIFSVAMLFSEALPNPLAPQPGGDRFPTSGVLDHCYSQTAACVRLADSFALGAAVYLVRQAGNQGAAAHAGGSYGALIRPNPRFNVGIMYVDVPDQSAAGFLALNRTVDEAMNVGFSWTPRNNLILSLDVRNVSEEEEVVRRELHWGGEWQMLPWCQLRAGFFRSTPERRNRFCGGAGIVTPMGHEETEQEGRGAAIPLQLVLHYGFQVESEGHLQARAHYLTCALIL